VLIIILAAVDKPIDAPKEQGTSVKFVLFIALEMYLFFYFHTIDITSRKATVCMLLFDSMRFIAALERRCWRDRLSGV
jgi:hypothetical protein